MVKLRFAKSRELFQDAQHVMVGGVSSPVRSFKAVGGKPLFIREGRGSKVWDVDGNVFIDYVLSWGPLIVGHANKVVQDSVVRAIRQGTSFGAPTEPELRLANEICRSVSGLERIRFVNSGTEATMTALRLARAFTSRDKVLKFEGCYHGHSDYFLTKAGSGLATLGVPDSSGVPKRVATDTITIPYNDLEAVETVFAGNGDKIAAVIVEPVAGNMGVVTPKPGFLSKIRDLCTLHGALLIFDEVITGFRLSRGGAQSLYRVKPDITCLGKVIGGGFPVGAIGGKKELMQLLAPEGKVYQAGTLSGNPVAMAAGLATLSLLDERRYRMLEATSASLQEQLEDSANIHDVDFVINRVGSMIGVFFARYPPNNFQEVKKSNRSLYARFHKTMLANGIYLPPSPYETVFLSTAHSEKDIAATVAAARKAFGELVR